MSNVDVIPASIVKAICQIQATMQAVAKSNRNAHGGYNFSSTDDIYAALTKKMGEVGLVIMALEVGEPEFKRIEGKDGKTAQWLSVVYQFVLATEEATWSDPKSKRTLVLQVTGAQTFQAAQSFAEKAYMRSLFKVPTGDVDLDSMPQAEFEEDQVALNANGKTKRKSSSGAKKDGTDKLFNEIKERLESAETTEKLQELRLLYNDEWETMPMQWNTLLENTFEDRMSDLRGRFS